MGSAKAWYFTALGVVALSLSSSTGRCLFDQVSSAVDQFRAKTMPYIAMLEMTVGHPRNNSPAQQSTSRWQETAARATEEQACAEAAAARVDAAKARFEAEQAARAEAVADLQDAVHRRVLAIPDSAWSKMISVPEQSVLMKRAMLANRAMISAKAWKTSAKFSMHHVTITPGQVVIEGPNGVVVAPRNDDINIPAFPPRPTEDLADPI
jgi:hypothetical protein